MTDPTKAYIIFLIVMSVMQIGMWAYFSYTRRKWHKAMKKEMDETFEKLLAWAKQKDAEAAALAAQLNPPDGEKPSQPKNGVEPDAD